MHVTLNGDRQTTQASTLARFLDEAGYSDAVVATAINGTFVPKSMRDTQTLCDGDAIEVLAPMQGG